MLFACIHVPDFPVQAALRADTEKRVSLADAVAVLDGPESLLKVFSCNERARTEGIEIGMTKLQAEAGPGVVLRKRVLEQEESAQAALLVCADGFSPRMESTCPGTVIVDLTGAARLLGPQQEMGQQLSDRAASCGLTPNIGIAGNPDTALHAARGFTGITVIAEGTEAKRLAGLPVEVLQPTPEMLDTLDSWGIHDFQALAALPSIPLTQRLGQPGLHLQRLARGEVRRELVLVEPPLLFQASLELEESVDLLEPLAFVLNHLLEELVGRLLARSLATDLVQVDLALEIHPDRQVHGDQPDKTASADVPVHQRSLKLPVPTQDARILLKLLQLDLAAHPPPAPVKKITVEVFPARVRLTQAGLFQPLAPEPAKLEVTMARLRAAVSEQDQADNARVGFAMVTDSHRPDSFRVLPYGMETTGHSNGGEDSRRKTGECLLAPQLVLRRFRPPLTARVEFGPGATAETAPVVVTFYGMKATVIQVCGPWRSGGLWWDQPGQWQREEWDVALNINGASGIYRIFRDLRSGQWYVEGMYD